MSLGRLFRDARLGFPALWGDGQPAGCRLDDEGSIRCLEMAHQVQLIRFGIWKARARPAVPDSITRREQHHVYTSLMEELLRLQEVRSSSRPLLRGNQRTSH